MNKTCFFNFFTIFAKPFGGKTVKNYKPAQIKLCTNIGGTLSATGLRFEP